MLNQTTTQIRPCTPDDAPLLSEISISTFYEAYAHNNDAAVMQSHTAQKFNPQQISLELQDANNQYYLAYSEGIAVGYLKLNLSNAANGLEIARIYARQTHWGRGVGQALLQQAITVAQTNRIPYIWLGVWQQNPRAISFYQKMGFVITGTMPYYMGDETQTDWIMKLKI